MLGPAGLGLIGLYQTLITTATNVGSLGVNSAGVKQLADAAGEGDQEAILGKSRALLGLGILLATVAGLLVWLFRSPIANHILLDPGAERHMIWAAVATALTIVSSMQLALLNGLRRTKRYGALTVASALAGTLLGLATLLIWGTEGIWAYVLVAPLAAVICGWLFTRRTLGRTEAASGGIGFPTAASSMIRLGIPFMLAALAPTAALLAIRTIVLDELGPASLGHFTAAWTLSVTYLGLIMHAVSFDYFPRLAAASKDRSRMNRLVNEQLESAILLAAPVLLTLQAGAPWIIHLLYSSEFEPGVDVLRWQIAGDVLKILVWPVVLTNSAVGAVRTFLAFEVFGAGLLCLLVWAGIDSLGLRAAGIAYLLVQLLLLPLIYGVARHRIGFRPAARVIGSGLALFLIVAALGLLGSIDARPAAAAGALTVLGSLAYLLRRLPQLDPALSPVSLLRRLQGRAG